MFSMKTKSIYDKTKTNYFKRNIKHVMKYILR